LSSEYSEKREFIFLGKSNVGKSSLINALVRDEKAMASSKSPGKTRELSVLDCVDYKIKFIDSPGYGYAENANEKERNKWRRMMEIYMKKHKQFHRAMLLVDA